MIVAFGIRPPLSYDAGLAVFAIEAFHRSRMRFLVNSAHSPVLANLLTQSQVTRASASGHNRFARIGENHVPRPAGILTVATTLPRDL